MDMRAADHHVLPTLSIKVLAAVLFALSLIPILAAEIALYSNSGFFSSPTAASRFGLIAVLFVGIALSHFAARYLLRFDVKLIKTIQVTAAAIIVIGATLFLYGKILNANWGMIDDHEIMVLLGADGKMGPGELISSLSQTEIYYFGVYTRFRPVYWLFRILETILWGNNVLIWYAARLCIFALFLFVFWMVSGQFIDFINAGLLTLFVLTEPYWTDIFGRLGSSEGYASIGLIGAVWACLSIINSLNRGGKSKLRDWLLFSLGLTVSIGSKENMLFLGFMLLFLLIFAWRKNEKQRAVIFGAVNAIMAALVLLAVYLSAQQSGQDIHSVSTSLSVRLADLRQFASTTIPSAILYSAGFCLLFALVVGLTKQMPAAKLGRQALWYGLVVAFLLIMVFTQRLFYTGNWPVINRYAFPGFLFAPALLLANYQFLSGAALLKNAGQAGLKLTVSLVLLVLIFLNGVDRVQQSIQRQVTVTNAFYSYVERLVMEIKENSPEQIVIRSAQPIDYETIFSLIRYLRVGGIQQPVFLNYLPADTVDPRSRDLDTYLREYAASGSFRPIFLNDWEYLRGEGLSRLMPMAGFDAQKSCGLIVISGEDSSFKQCVVIQ